MSYSNPLSIDWNGNHFILTRRTEIDSNNILYSQDGIEWSENNISAINPYNTSWTGKQQLIMGEMDEMSQNVILKSNIENSYNTSVTSELNPIYGIESAIELPNKIIFPENKLIAFGGNTEDSVKIVYSLNNGDTWIPTTNSNLVFTNYCSSAKWNGKIWAATGSGANTIATSSNGIDWVGRGSYIFTDFASTIIWSDELSMWVAGGSGTNSIAYSYDGIYWVGLGISIFSRVNSIAWNGKQFIACGLNISNNSNTVAYSYNGIDWTAVSAFSDECKQCIWNNTYWVAIGADNTHNMAVSTNGIQWTLFTNVDILTPSHISISNTGIITIIDSSINRVGITKSNDFSHMQLFDYSEPIISSYSTPDFYFLTSTNILRTADVEIWPNLNTGYSISNLSLINGIEWNYPNKGHATIKPYSIAVGEGSNTIAYSTDGILWKGLGKNIFNERGNKVVWNGKLWVAVGKGNYSIAYSYDGLKWNGISNSLLTEGNDVEWNGNVFIACGKGTRYNMVVSFDGIVWTGIANSIPLFPQYISSVTWTGKHWIAYGCGDGKTSTSAYSFDTNGLNWSETNPKNLAIENVNNYTTYIMDLSGSSGESDIESIKTWTSANEVYDVSNGAYIGEQHSQGISGEWLFLQTDTDIILHYYKLEWDENASPPSEWYLYSVNIENEYTLIEHVINTSEISPVSNYIIRNISSNQISNSVYQFIFPSIFPNNSFISISNIKLYGENDNTGIISDNIKPIVTKTNVLHPFLFDYRIFTLEGDEIPFNNINQTMFKPSYLNKKYTSYAFDGDSLLLTDISGSISYISNEELNTSHLIDMSFNNISLQSSLDEIHDSCYNGNRLLIAGKKNGVGSIEYHGPISKEIESETFHECFRVNLLFDSVNGIASNSKYGFVKSFNRIYLNKNDKLNIISPHSYSTDGNTLINIKLMNSKQIQQIVLPTETIISTFILGSTGPTGPIGNGQTGPTGDRGLTNEEIGPTGENAEPDEINWLGPTGTVGPTGEKGINGEMGINGPINTELWDFTDNTNTTIQLFDKNVIIGNIDNTNQNQLAVENNVNISNILYTNSVKANIICSNILTNKLDNSDGVDISGVMVVKGNLTIGNSISNSSVNVMGDVHISNKLNMLTLLTTYILPDTVTENGILIDYNKGDHFLTNIDSSMSNTFMCTIQNIQEGNRLVTINLYTYYSNTADNRPICTSVIINNVEYQLKMKEGLPTISLSTVILIQEIQICIINSEIISTICMNSLI